MGFPYYFDQENTFQVSENQESAGNTFNFHLKDVNISWFFEIYVGQFSPLLELLKIWRGGYKNWHFFHDNLAGGYKNCILGRGLNGGGV